MLKWSKSAESRGQKEGNGYATEGHGNVWWN